MLKPLKAAHDTVSEASFVLSGGALAVITLAYLYQVAMRYFFKTPSSWSGDLVSYLLIVMVFLALPKITKERRHIAVTFLTEKLGGSNAVIAHRLANILGCIMCLGATGLSGIENLNEISNNIYTMGNHPIPKFWLSSTITYGFLGTGLYFFRAIFEAPPRQNTIADDFAGRS